MDENLYRDPFKKNVENRNMRSDNYDINIVKKPWGYEYLAYQNEHVALWFLFIKHNQSTSLHCHPKKTTGLVLLDGNVDVSFFTDTKNLKPGDKIMIRKGLFHSTKAVSEKGAHVFEIETPVDKQDLVRFKDNYGREGKPYEDSTHEILKNEDCIFISNPPLNTEIEYNLSNCTLTVKSITDVSSFKEIGDSTNVMFLDGGIKSDYGQNVASPGDVVISSTIKKLTEIFNKVDPKTIIMIIKYNG
jgi:mannose-6-phosphate isomerase-like protein (cupin superfamily)